VFAQYKITMTIKKHDITVLNQDSFVKVMHMAASVRDPCRTQITPQHNSLNTRIKTPLAAAIRYLIYKHITFLRHKVIRALPNATVFCIVVVIIRRVARGGNFPPNPKVEPNFSG